VKQNKEGIQKKGTEKTRNPVGKSPCYPKRRRKKQSHTAHPSPGGKGGKTGN